MQVVIFIGIQASGKSTFFKQRFVDTHIRVNLDMLRTRHREALIYAACLEAKQPVVIDNTNLTAADRLSYIAQAKTAQFNVSGYYFRSKVSDSIARNQKRETGVVPDVAILASHRKLELPTRAEGFDQLFYVSLNETGSTFVVEDWADGL